MASDEVVASVQQLERSILLIRGKRVMLDAQLAALYGVETRVLLQAVKRNSDRFPNDFMFQINEHENKILRSQSVISSERGGRRYQPYVFTEQGVAMLSSVLRSKRAVQVNITIMRAFVHMRQMIEAHEDLSRRIDALEARFDGQFKIVFDAIRRMMAHPDRVQTPIGFKPTPEQ